MIARPWFRILITSFEDLMNEGDFDDGLRQILVCAYGADCAEANQRSHGTGTALYDAIKKVRNALGLKRKLYVVGTTCQGWCEYAPVCTVLPEGQVRGHVTVDQAEKFIQFAIGQGIEQGAGDFVWNLSKSRSENELKKKCDPA
jgi:(2Fe-2S) ferredoxin